MDPLGHLVVTGQMLRTVAEIDEFKGRWEALGKLAPERLTTLRRIATIESIGSSTRIEGVKLTDDEIGRLLSGLGRKSFRTRDEQEVGGYAELMELIYESFAEIAPTENHIRQLHGVLLKHSAKDARHRGEYKTHPNSIEAFGADGRSLGVIFETASPFDTPRLMQELVAWARSALETPTHHPLLVIGAFVVRFLAIHPFEDGNGRLSRALTTLLLLRSGYAYAPYCSLERIVEENKDSYYLALRRAQATLDADEAQLGDWLSFFLRCLVSQKEILAEKIERERRRAPLPRLSEKILAIARENGRVTVREAAALTEANRNTVQEHLKRLVRTMRLAPRGQGKGTWYEIP